MSVIVLLRFSLIAAQRSLASLRAILSQGISQATTPRAPRPPAHRPRHVQLDVSTMRPLAERRDPIGLRRVLVQAQALHSYGLASMLSRCCSTLDSLELVPAPTHLPAGCCVIVHRDRRSRRGFPAATFLHRRDLHALAGCLQIALSAIVALASALATHRQPPKCATLSSHPFAIRLIC